MAGLAAISLLPLGLLTSVALSRSEEALEQEVDGRIRSTVQASARSVESEMHGLRNLVQSYARRPSLLAAVGDGSELRDEAGVRLHLEELRSAEEGIAIAFIADVRGNYLDGVPDTPSIVRKNFSHRDWYRGVTAAGGPYVSEAYRSAITGQPLVTAAAVPIRVTGRGGETATAAILVAAFSLDRLERHTESVAAQDGFRVVVTDQRGQLIAGRGRPDDRMVSLAGDMRVRAALNGEAGAGTVRVGDDTLLSAHAPIPALGWTVIGEMPRRSALAPLEGVRSTLLALSGLLTAAICAALLLSARSLRQRRAFMTELAEAHREALAASSVKSEFLATMSHEIRTPMNGVLGLLGVLRSTGLDDDQRQLVETAESSAVALLSIINDVLDFSRIEARRLELEDGAVDVRRLLDEVRGLLASQAEQKGLGLDVRVEGDVPALVRGDPGRLRQVVLNLAGNAIKFTAAGSVTVTAGVRGGELSIEVIDTGIGMTQETIGRLFDSFTQADRSTTRLYGGSGLGLAISRRLVQLMGGAIGVNSRLGQGSRFWVNIPLQELASPDAPTTADTSVIRVLVVDDQLINREMLNQSLTGWGMDATVCGSAESALAILQQAAKQQDPFDVVLIDHEMEGMDGIQLAESITVDSALAGTHLLLLSSSNRSVDPRAARRAGIATWLTKPVRASALYDAITAGVEARTSRPRMRPPLADTPRPERALRVLLAEDNLVNQQVAVRMLELRGFSVDVVANGRAAVEAAQSSTYDAILMDCQMPEMDGFEATMAIRALTSSSARVPIIALTAGAMEGDVAKSLAAGMTAHVTKPVAWDEAARLIRGLAEGGPPAELTARAARPGVLDQTSLDELREMGGDEQVDRLMATFLIATTERMAEAWAASRAGDGERLASICHGVRGAASTFGAHELARAALDLEQVARSSPTKCLAGLAALQAAFDAVKAEVDRVLAGSAPRAGEGRTEAGRR